MEMKMSGFKHTQTPQQQLEQSTVNSCSIRTQPLYYTPAPHLLVWPAKPNFPLEEGKLGRVGQTTHL